MDSTSAVLTVLLAFLALTRPAHALRELHAVSTIENESISWIAERGTGTAPLPLSDPRVARSVNRLLPDQIHLTYMNASAVTVSWAHLADAKPSVYALIGDYTYADDYLTDGTVAYTGFPNNTFNSSIPQPIGSYQPRWDSYFRYTQYINSKVPLIPNHGNHELEPQDNAAYGKNGGLDGGRQFNSYISRIPVPYKGSNSSSPLWYSVDVGPVHIISLSNYDDFSPGSPQYKFLTQDLAKVDRTKTPWLIATWHAPWYSSYTTHYKETECMRQSMETMMYEAGVDVVFNGHLHEYERTNPVYNYTVNQCGAVHITMGDGGNIEGLYKTFIDQPGAGNCPKPNTLPNYQPGPYCPSFTFDLNNQFAGYCGTKQPGWSAFREPAFGHGLLTFQNATHALWQWNRNWDDESVNLDQVYIIRDRTCKNQPSLAVA
ncbi:hypothetical protein WJX72_006186 [[Myrmecia] bisecta]|uniref:Acid phosphatase n=1 Tax=[Myrmecia] bisecta TaxID=41462 RepID=A0AAW1Q3S4_9CHLO